MSEQWRVTALAHLAGVTERLNEVAAERERAVIAARRHGATLAQIAVAAGITEAGASKMCHRLGTEEQ